jgi:hypothetical protein
MSSHHIIFSSHHLRLLPQKTPSILLRVRVRVRVTLRLPVYRQSFRLSAKPLETHDQYFIFELNICCYNPHVTSSLTRGWVYRLQLLLALTSAVILRSEFPGTHDHILLSQTRDSATWRARSPELYPPGTGWPSYTPRHWVPFSSPPTTRRARGEVFEPASKRCSSILLSCFRSMLYDLGAAPTENTVS